MNGDDIAKKLVGDNSIRQHIWLRVGGFLETINAYASKAVTVLDLALKKTLNPLTIDLTKFNGNVKKWFLFWSVFNEVHGDLLIRNKDKFQYLI